MTQFQVLSGIVLLLTHGAAGLVGYKVAAGMLIKRVQGAIHALPAELGKALEDELAKVGL